MRRISRLMLSDGSKVGLAQPNLVFSPSLINNDASNAAGCELDRQTAHDHVHGCLRAAIDDRAPGGVVGNRSHAAGKRHDELAIAARHMLYKRFRDLA